MHPANYDLIGIKAETALRLGHELPMRNRLSNPAEVVLPRAQRLPHA
jgi:hypothetical protein